MVVSPSGSLSLLAIVVVTGVFSVVTSKSSPAIGGLFPSPSASSANTSIVSVAVSVDPSESVIT